MKNYIILISLCAFAACGGQTAPPTANQVLKATNSGNAAPGNSVSAVAVSPTATPDKTKIRTFDGKGVVTKINLELGSVGLNHEEIKGVMAAMENMEFYVSDKKMLDGLKIGDAVDFVLEDNAGVEQIVSIKKAK